MGRASKESGGARQAWGPRGGGLRCRLEWAKLVPLILQSSSSSQMRKGRRGREGTSPSPLTPSGLNLPEALCGSSHPSWAEALETPWSSTLEPYPSCPALPPIAPTLVPDSSPGGPYGSQKPPRAPSPRWAPAADASWSSSPSLQHAAAAVAGRSLVGHISPSHVWPLMGVGRGSYVISLQPSGESASCPSHSCVFDSPLQVPCTQVALKKHQRG